MSDPVEFKLSALDVTSGVWVKLKQHYEGRLSMLRAKNDNQLDEIETATVRGMIRVYKEMLEAGKPAENITIYD